jgi:hypothetical protein
MRLWSLHPEYLDAKGLVALWREALLAKKVLEGLTKGYKNHPQLDRFRQVKEPVDAMSQYLYAVLTEAKLRNYNFDGEKAGRSFKVNTIKVTRGQIDYEWQHLLKKLEKRDRNKYLQIKDEKAIKPHPLFRIVDGEIESWEKII